MYISLAFTKLRSPFSLITPWGVMRRQFKSLTAFPQCSSTGEIGGGQARHTSPWQAGGPAGGPEQPHSHDHHGRAEGSSLTQASRGQLASPRKAQAKPGALSSPLAGHCGQDSVPVELVFSPGEQASDLHLQGCGGL